MTNVYATPEKVTMKNALFSAAITALEQDGWKVERVAGSGKSSVRRITKGTVSKTISIRTTQDRSIAFPRTAGDKGWRTLDEVDAVVAAAVDDRWNPKFANIHLLDGDEMRDRFNRTYAARKAADHVIPVGRGVWLSLYSTESNSPVHLVGAGAGLAHPPFAKVPLDADRMTAPSDDDAPDEDGLVQASTVNEVMAVARERLASLLGVATSAIKLELKVEY
ncbi:hypothetical protein [Bradyrhizobium yuanmingense]|uniref:hypothetical protein n=1 Tax=Bradyrhizobium yuanmingense TaxID=108015 RepID=UPI001CD6B07D|nr:hypothetical protein [Bradyrhizobium yuanmingense]MCA1527859.1 hypothetical protein [Bradyrhizobium yuanmingense]